MNVAFGIIGIIMGVWWLSLVLRGRVVQVGRPWSTVIVFLLIGTSISSGILLLMDYSFWWYFLVGGIVLYIICSFFVRKAIDKELFNDTIKKH
ncbi:MAG: hypothetical protein C4542_07815 [Dehalococcoidia bacterium]|nr:MAG: hypothetical protein C4542_07815 [Dehalococcoidia bacterium]